LGLNIIVATDLNGVIGNKGTMPWGRLPNDLNFFRRQTEGKIVIMGRKTYDSIGKPLPNRENIVISRTTDTRQQGIQVHSFETVKQIVDIESKLGDVYIIGGETIYKQFLPYVDRIYKTVIEAEFEGDTIFPDFTNYGQWVAVLLDEKEPDDKNKYKCSFYKLDKVPEKLN
jgi:dihydrofolate reductase